jgi:hypothetical protein
MIRYNLPGCLGLLLGGTLGAVLYLVLAGLGMALGVLPEGAVKGDEEVGNSMATLMGMVSLGAACFECLYDRFPRGKRGETYQMAHVPQRSPARIAYVVGPLIYWPYFGTPLFLIVVCVQRKGQWVTAAIWTAATIAAAFIVSALTKRLRTLPDEPPDGPCMEVTKPS